MSMNACYGKSLYNNANGAVSVSVGPAKYQRGLIDDTSILLQVMVCTIRQQSIIWANTNPNRCRHMSSPGRYELTTLRIKSDKDINEISSTFQEVCTCFLLCVIFCSGLVPVMLTLSWRVTSLTSRHAKEYRSAIKASLKKEYSLKIYIYIYI